MIDEARADGFAEELVVHSRFRLVFRLAVNGAAIGLLFFRHHQLLAALPMLALLLGWDIHRLHVKALRGQWDGPQANSPWLPIQMALAKTGLLWLVLAIVLWFGGW